MRIRHVVALGALCMLPCAVRAAVPGGGPASSDCQLELDTPKPNYPMSVPGKARVAKELRCFDGDAGCDVDGEVNGVCQFPLDACFGVSDPALAGCTPGTVTSFAVGGAGGNPELRALQQAGQALLPATGNVCTSGQTVGVKLRGKGKKSARRTVRLKARAGGSTDADRVALTCLPREWPLQGYDHRNRRATPRETTLDPGNASQIAVKWLFDIEALEGTDDGTNVSSTPTVANGMVFVTAWNGKVYGLRARDGKLRWSYDTGSGAVFGVQSSATLTPEGRLLIGDSFGLVHALEAKTGTLLWKGSVADTDPEAAHVWGSPQVANGRVFVGRASHSDVPCTQGHLYAFDLETGAELWRYKTVPDAVCSNDTAVTCTTAADCGGAECLKGIGGGVTATVAIDPNGETVYMGSVGCYRFPSIGNSDSLFSLDAGTGSAHWIQRTRSIEPYRGPRSLYQDFGFLNGPLLVDAPDGGGGRRRLLLGPSKDGTIYAVDPSTGSLVWSYALAPDPVFAGFGLFNAGTAWANDTLYASLDGGTFFPDWPETNDHLYAFSGVDGAPRWSAQIGESWSPVAIANGLLFVGANGADEFYVYDTATGARLNTIPLPASVVSGASVVDGVVYVGYGGGMVALGLP